MHKITKAVFLDRDGTLNFDPGFVRTLSQFRIYKNTIPALKLLQNAGFKLFIVTNQSGVGRKIISKSNLNKIHAHLTMVLLRHGIKLTEILVCPHHPDDKCRCRKPKPYLVTQAIKKYNLTPSECYMIGDTLRDIECGFIAGINSVLVLTGNGEKTKSQISKNIPASRNILSAAKVILACGKK